MVPFGNRKNLFPDDLLPLEPKTHNQELYLEALYSDIPIVIGRGPAGTGKTAISYRSALQQVLEPSSPYDKVIITRNIVESSNSIGFLPGPQRLSSKVLTPSGWTTMGELSVGDKVMASDGTVTYVTEVHDFEEQDVYEIRTTTGKVTHSTESHLWKTKNYNEFKHNKEGQVRSLREIMDTLTYNNGKINHYLPRPEPIQFDHKEKDLHPYVLGALLGDGYFGDSVSIASIDPEIVDKIDKELRKINAGVLGCCDISYTLGAIDGRANKPEGKNQIGRYTNPVKLELDKYGLMYKKFDSKYIPHDYIYCANVEDRMELLRGLLDTDGTVHRGQAEFFTSNLQLAQDVVDLVRSLGGSGHIHSRMRDYVSEVNGKIVKSTCPSHAVTIKLPEQVGNPFYLSRKAKQYKTRGSDGRKLGVTSDRIDTVEWFSKEPVRCIKIDHREHLYITDNFIVTHNTMSDKIDPYLAPYKALSQDFLNFNEPWKLLNDLGNVEFVCSNYIRGITLDRSIIIIDEAQTFSYETLKDIITRAGYYTKIVISGDVAQDDLAKIGQRSGLGKLCDVLKLMPYGDVAEIEFTLDDIVRGGICKNFLISHHDYHKG